MSTDTERPVTTRIESWRVGDLRRLAPGRNARFMSKPQMDRLISNIKKDGCLTSTPLATYDQGPDVPPLVLSGNHRTMAAERALGEDAKIAVMVAAYEDGSPIDRQRALAMQLSHNAITGQDDARLLQELYSELVDIDMRDYAGLDDRTLDLLNHDDVPALPEASLEWQTISVLFLPTEVEKAKKAMAEALDIIGSTDEVWLATRAQHDAFLDAVQTSGSAYAIRNIATSLEIILAIWRAHVTDLAEGFMADSEVKEEARSRWVPLWTIIGTDKVPGDVAAIIRAAIEKMMGDGDLKADERWRALEVLAAEYLAGA